MDVGDVSGKIKCSKKSQPIEKVHLRIRTLRHANHGSCCFFRLELFAIRALKVTQLVLVVMVFVLGANETMIVTVHGVVTMVVATTVACAGCVPCDQ
jgi:hypothetical protein